jgi:cysteine desulfurase / selenocysteine lyase
MMNWSEIRKEFPVCQKYVYLNPAGGSPLSESAAGEAIRFYNEMLQTGDIHYGEWMEQTERIRIKLANLLGAGRNEIAFTTNTSHGMNLVAHMVGSKGKVLTMEHEFPSSTFPWINLGIPVKTVKASNDFHYPIEAIEKAIDPGVKILVTSYVQYCTGFRQDLYALGKVCKEHGLLFVVNGTQAIPVFPVDVKRMQIDFLVFTGLKWATAGYGIGGLYMDEKWLGSMPFAGWQSTREPETMHNLNLEIKQEASALEGGCPHFGPVFALGGALDLFARIGHERVMNRILELTAHLHAQLIRHQMEIASPLRPEQQSGITIIKTNKAAELVSLLALKNIFVSARGAGLRVSVNLFNNEEDIDTLMLELVKHRELISRCVN